MKYLVRTGKVTISSSSVSGIKWLTKNENNGFDEKKIQEGCSKRR